MVRARVIISIHSPRAGRDPCPVGLGVPSCEFQSTRPVRGETVHSKIYLQAKRFQSTRPVRGETWPRPQHGHVPDAISIHSPRAGRDAPIDMMGYVITAFQSTRPVRGETCVPAPEVCQAKNFNPLAPCGARLEAALQIERENAISIHSPRAGRDRIARHGQARALHFNPLAPCGARRHSTLPVYTQLRHFNPLAPCGARLRAARPQGIEIKFQSTRPVRGETRSLWDPPFLRSNFNPLAPCGARRSVSISDAFAICISIHSPRAGRDQASCFICASTLHISIHSPRAGRDTSMIRLLKSARLFQSTRPVRGETLPSNIKTSLSLFQSTRPVRGETRVPLRPYSPHSIFQSTRPVRGETAKVYKLYCYGSYTSDKKTLFEAFSPVCCMLVFLQQAGLPSAKHTGYFLPLPLRTDSYHQNVLCIIAFLYANMADFP